MLVFLCVRVRACAYVCMRVHMVAVRLFFQLTLSPAVYVFLLMNALISYKKRNISFIFVLFLRLLYLYCRW